MSALTREEIATALRRLGLKAGAAVMVHSSLSSMGYVQGGARTVVNALLEVGEHTLTLLFGTAHDFPYQFHGGDAPPIAQTITINVVGGQRIFFIEPQDGADLREFPFKVKVGSSGVDESSGHYVITWDVYPFPPEGQPVPEDDNRIHLEPGQTEIDLDIKAGGHEFNLLFVDANNMVGDPPLTDKIDVAVWKPVKLEGMSPFLGRSRPATFPARRYTAGMVARGPPSGGTGRLSSVGVSTSPGSTE